MLVATGLLLAADRAFSNPVTQLPPGRVTLAHVPTPEGTATIVLHRIFYDGHVSLCVTESIDRGAVRIEGTNQCANYPVGPTSGQGIGKAPMWRVAGIEQCAKPGPYELAVGVMLRAGVSAWLRTAHGLARMPMVKIPAAFHVAGPLAFEAVMSQSSTIVVRDAHEKTVYTSPVDLRC